MTDLRKASGSRKSDVAGTDHRDLSSLLHPFSTGLINSPSHNTIYALG
jgi:hypothetical protein